MPATSQAQFRLMQAVAHGVNLPGVHISTSKAEEYVHGQSPTGLPSRKVKRKRKPASK